MSEALRMKKWGLGILSAFLTFTLGLCATTIVRIRLAPMVKIPPIYDGANTQIQLPLPQIKEDTQPTNEVEEIMQPHQVSISPDEIKRLIGEDKLSPCLSDGYSGYFDFEPIWEKLNLKISDESGAFPERCSPPAKANIYAVELDGKPGNETLLKLDFGTPESTLYLIFKRGGSQSSVGAEWSLLGYVAYEYGAPFLPPSHRVITAGTKRWLVFDLPTGHGSSFGSQADEWYEVSENGVVPVLSYQNGLFIGLGANPMIDRTTKVVSVKYQDGVATVILKSVTSYECAEKLDDIFSVWTTERKVTFIKGPGMQQFVFDPLHSEMTVGELDPRFGFDAFVSDEEILKYNYRELARIAVRGNVKQKDWLRNYLDVCDESLEKQSLQTALGDSQP
jgi:hypothetical protein